MTKINTPKKPALNDWHKADIKCALEKHGWSLRRLSIANGYTPTSASVPLRNPWPRMEKIIADAIGVTPETIWPSRYGPDGKSNRKSGYTIETHGSTRRKAAVIPATPGE